MKINGILDIFYGDGDWSFIFTDTLTGKQVRAKHVGGEGNIRAIQLYMNGGNWPSDNQPRFYVTQRDMKTREYTRFTADFPYISSSPEMLARHIKNAIS